MPKANNYQEWLAQNPQQTSQDALSFLPEAEAPNYSESTDEMLKALLQYNPQLVEQNWNAYSGYAPKEAALSYDLASQYIPLYQELARKGRTADRGADISDVLSLAPSLQGIRAASERPEMGQLRNTLFSQIMGELASGTKLAPEQDRMLNEEIRSAQMARGLSGGTGAANRESVRKALEGMNLQTQRQEKAKSLMSMEQSQAPDPFLTILGRPATAQQTGMAMYSNPAQSAVAGSAPGADFYLNNFWNQTNAQQANDRYNMNLALAKNDYNKVNG
jgi:hypothetical protein